MAIHPLSAARTIGRISNWSLSNLEINKMLYFAELIRSGRSNGQERFLTRPFEAWDYGPVSPDVYHKAKIYGSDPVGDVFHAYNFADGRDGNLINRVYETLKDKSPGELVAITHWEQGAWARNYRPGIMGVVIPERDIIDEYRRRKR